MAEKGAGIADLSMWTMYVLLFPDMDKEVASDTKRKIERIINMEGVKFPMIFGHQLKVVW